MDFKQNHKFNVHFCFVFIGLKTILAIFSLVCVCVILWVCCCCCCVIALRLMSQIIAKDNPRPSAS